MKACEFTVKGEERPLSYDEMRLYLLNNPEFWKNTLNTKKNAVQKQVSNAGVVQPTSGNSEEMEGGKPEPKPESTAGKEKAKPTKKEKVDESEPIVASLESKAESGGETELHKVVQEVDKIIAEEEGRVASKKKAESEVTRAAKAKHKETVATIVDTVTRAVEALKQKFPYLSEEGKELDSSILEEAAEFLRSKGFDVIKTEAKPNVYRKVYREGKPATIQSEYAIQVKTKDGTYVIPFQDPQYALDLVNKMPKSVEGGVSIKTGVGNGGKMNVEQLAFKKNTLKSFIAARANLDEARKVLAEAKAKGQKATAESAQKLINLFLEANNSFVMDLRKLLLSIPNITEEQRSEIGRFIQDKLSYEALELAPPFPTIPENFVGDKAAYMADAVQKYFDALRKAQEYVDATTEQKIEMDKQVLRDYFDSFKRIGIASNPKSLAQADINALKAAIRLIKSIGAKTAQDVIDFLKINKGAKETDQLRRVLKAAFYFQDTDPSESDLADYYEQEYPQPKEAPKAKEEEDEEEEDEEDEKPTLPKIGEKGELAGETRIHATVNRFGVDNPIFETLGSNIFYESLSTEKVWELVDKVFAQKPSTTEISAIIRDKKVHDAVRTAIAIKYYATLDEMARNEKNPEKAAKLRFEANEVQLMLLKEGEERGQAINMMRFMHKISPASQIAFTRSLVYNAMNLRYRNFAKKTLDVLNDYKKELGKAAEKVVYTKAADSAFEAAYKGTQAAAKTMQTETVVAKARTRKEAIDKAKNLAIEALQKLKVDTKNNLSSMGVILEATNLAVDAMIVAVKGGASVAKAIDAAMRKANERMAKASKPEIEAYANNGKKALEDQLRAAAQPLVEAEKADLETLHEKTQEEADKILKRTLDDFKREAREITKKHFEEGGDVGRTLASKFQEMGLTADQSKALAVKMEDYMRREMESKNKAILDKFLKKINMAKINGKELSEQDKARMLASLNKMMKDFTSAEVGVRQVFEEVVGAQMPEDFDKKLNELYTKIKEAKNDIDRSHAEQALADYTANVVQPTVWEYLENVYYGNILSGLPTFFNNAFGVLFKLPVSTIVNAVDAALATKNPKLTFYSFLGFLNGAYENSNYALDVLLHGKQYDRGYGVEARPLLERKSIKEIFPDSVAKQWLARIVANPTLAKYIPRGLNAMDVLLYNAGTEMDLYQYAIKEAARIAQAEGKGNSAAVIRSIANERILKRDAPQLAKFIEEAKRLNNREGQKDTFINRVKNDYKDKQIAFALMREARKELIPESQFDESKHWGARFTYNYTPEGTLGVMARLLNKAKRRLPILKYIIPFVNIPINVLNQALDATPWGFIRAGAQETSGMSGLMRKFGIKPEGTSYSTKMSDQRRRETIGRALFGASLMIALAFLDDGSDDPLIEFTAEGYGDFNKNKDLKNRPNRGYQEYSLRIGNVWVSYKDWPLAPMLAFWGSMMDYERYGNKNAKNLGMYLINRMARYFNNATFLGSLNGFLSLLDPVASPGNRGIVQGAAEEIGRKMMAMTTPEAAFIRTSMNAIYDLFDVTQRGNLSRDKRNLGLNAALENTMMRSFAWIPVVRDGYGKVYNSLGEEVPVEQRVMFFDIVDTKEKLTPVDRLYQVYGGSISTPKANYIFNFNTGESYPMTSNEYQLYKKMNADYVREALVPQVDLIEDLNELYKLKDALVKDENDKPMIEDGKPYFKTKQDGDRYLELVDKIEAMGYDVDASVLTENLPAKILKAAKREAAIRARTEMSLAAYPVPGATDVKIESDEEFEDEVAALVRKR